MANRYQLRGLSNEQLLGALSALVAQNNAVTADLLAHLSEVERRRLHLELGYPSMFAYCTEALGFSESAAGRRIAAARICRKHGDAFELVARGEVHLSALCSLGPHLNDDNATDLLRACIRKSRRQVDELLAARFPRADLPEAIRRLPEARFAPLPSPALEPPAAVQGGNSNSARAPEPARMGGEANRAAVPLRMERPHATVEPLSAGRYGVRFTADERLRDKLDQARALASHRLQMNDLAGLIELALDALIRDLQKQRFAVGRRARDGKQPMSVSEGTTTGSRRETGTSARGARKTANGSRRAPVPLTGHGSPAGDERSRYIPAAVAREVYERDEGQCTFVSTSGRLCSARHFLEFDHIEPWAEGGASDARNVRLRCKAHNQHLARLHFGNERIESAIARARSTRNRPHPPAGAQ